MLVSVGAALVIIVSTYGFNDVVAESGVVLDPSRIAAQVVTGIGFIGAGTIIANPDKVRGLTTAASLWAVAGIGLAAGAGLYGPAIAATVLVMIILVPFKYVEGWLFHRQGPVDD
jgi:putative Mg2+ transporter-C (MgtC) family protein